MFFFAAVCCLLLVKAVNHSLDGNADKLHIPRPQQNLPHLLPFPLCSSLSRHFLHNHSRHFPNYCRCHKTGSLFAPKHSPLSTRFKPGSKMSETDMKSKTRKVVDHAVVFRMKDELTEEQENAMLDALFTLQYQTKGVLYLSAGPVLEKTADGVTHALFARFATKEDVDAYMQHPARLSIARELVVPYYNGLAMLDVEDEVVDDLEAIFGREFAQGGGIDHLVLFKVKEGTSQESVDAMLQSFRDLAASLDPSILFQLTAGTNISPVGKGYTHGFIARIPSDAALEAFVKSDGYIQALSKEALPDGTEFIAANLPSAFRGSGVTLHG